MTRFSIIAPLAAALLASVTNAAVAEPLDKRQLVCLAPELIVDILRPDDGNTRSASEFCSSYNGVTRTVSSRVVTTRTVITTQVSSASQFTTIRISVPGVTRTVTTTVPKPTPSGQCDIAGYVKEGGTQAFFVQNDDKSASYEGCSALCKANTKCKSFAFSLTSCLLFDVTVAANINAMPTAEYVFFDVSCPPPTGGWKSKTPKRQNDDPFLRNACSCLVKKPSTVTKIVGGTETTTQYSTVVTKKIITTIVQTETQRGGTVTTTVTVTAS